MDYSSSTPRPFDLAAGDPEACRDDGTVGAAAAGLQVFRPNPLLADIVEDIWDWDVPDPAIAHRVALQVSPSPYAYLLFQYRVPLSVDWRFGARTVVYMTQRDRAVKMQSGLATVRPIGPVGSVLVRVKPEAADRVIQMPMLRGLDRWVGLPDIFKPSVLTRLNESLYCAGDARMRVAAIESLLITHHSPTTLAAPIARAAASLRFNPSLSVHELAAKLGISARHLSRGFKAAFGTGPKYFARLARVEKAFTARREGHGWTEIAHACGFADQAHLIHDFQAIAGATPEEIFRPPLFRSMHITGAVRARSFFNLFIG
jgi:AraC-like DNA-binding protein